MNLSAIYHRATDNYCYALNNDQLIISLRTGYDVESVILCHGDPFSTGIMGSNTTFEHSDELMSNQLKLKNHIIHSIKITPPFKRVCYFFSIKGKDGELIYLFEDNFYTPEQLKNYKGHQQPFYMPWMNPSDVFTTPKWVNDTIWYQIFIDRFCNENPLINPKNLCQWSDADTTVKPTDYYGGDLQGISSKLDYLSSLGITGIYLTPVCKGKSNHKYDTSDYSIIDPAFGKDLDMKVLVEGCHSHNIKVMMDGVFNHSGAFFEPWLDVVENGPASEYYDWFMINSWPFDKSSHNNNSRAGKYYSFAFFDFMPKLNTNNPKVINYIVEICTGWVNKYNIDGLRLDVAGEISHTLCKELRKRLKSLKPDFYILGELWHDSTPWLRGDEFDSVMNYPFTDCINNFWQDTSQTSTDLEYDINRCYSLYMEQVNNVLFNLLDSHDTNRLFNKTMNLDKFYQQLAILFTMPGSVCIYYGTEIAMDGSFDPDCRRCMPWTNIEKGEYNERLNKIEKLIALRKKYKCLRSGKYTFNHNFENKRIICYTRFDEFSEHNVSNEHSDFECRSNKITVVINSSAEKITIEVNKNQLLFEQFYFGNELLPDGVLIFFGEF